MKRLAGLYIALSVSALIGGCLPQELVVWSPDGRQAAVLLDYQLRLCSADGTLGDPLVEDVLAAAWFGDSRRLCLVIQREMDNWPDIAAAIGSDEAGALTAAADKLAKAVLGGADWEQTVKLPLDRKKLTDSQVAAIKLYLRQTQWDQLKDRVGGLWGEPDTATIVCVIVGRLNDGKIDLGKPIGGSVLGADSPRVSPDGRFVAFVTPSPGFNDQASRLRIAATDGATPIVTAAENVARFPDWSADGRSVVYARGLGGSDQPQIAAIESLTVRGEDGAILEEFGDPDTLAGLLFDPGTQVRCLSDGRVFFSATELHLPTTAEDLPSKPGLFSVWPGKSPTVTRLIPHSVENEVGDSMHFFRLSPDATRVAIPASDGTVAILTLATGEVSHVQTEKDAESDLQMTPTWRNNDELTILVPGTSQTSPERRPEIVMWSENATRSLSADWPEELLATLMPKSQLQFPVVTTQP